MRLEIVCRFPTARAREYSPVQIRPDVSLLAHLLLLLWFSSSTGGVDLFCGGPILLSKVSRRALRWHPATGLTNLLTCLLRELFPARLGGPAPGSLPPQNRNIRTISFDQDSQARF